VLSYLVADRDLSDPVEFDTVCAHLTAVSESACQSADNADESGASSNGGAGAGAGPSNGGRNNDAQRPSPSEETVLAEMFPRLALASVKRALEHSCGSVAEATDYLLALEAAPKGVDGFFAPESAATKAGAAAAASASPQPPTASRKNRGKKNKRLMETAADIARHVYRRASGSENGTSRRRSNSSSLFSLSTSDFSLSSSPPTSSAVLTNNNNNTEVMDVAFIEACFDMPYSEAARLYHVAGSSRELAILEFLRACEAHGVRPEGDGSRATVAALCAEFPAISPSLMATLVHVVEPGEGWREQVARLLHDAFPAQRLGATAALLSPAWPAAAAAAQRDAAAATTDDDDREAAFTVVGPGKRRKSPPLAIAVGAPQQQQQTPRCRPSSPTSTAAIDALYARSAQAASYAGSLTRSGNKYMRQAAHIYNERARGARQTARDQQSAEADRLVASKSTAAHMDLHGVTVEDGRRIARDGVEEWWASSSAPSSAARGGFTIVTGRGNHCANGVSQLRGAVKADLVRGGWRFDEMRGSFVVRGRR
jgi:hypothetical protein